MVIEKPCIGAGVLLMQDLHIPEVAPKIRRFDLTLLLPLISLGNQEERMAL
jgi:hypothetical protein